MGLLRKSEMEAIKLDDTFHNSSTMFSPKAPLMTTKGSNSSKILPSSQPKTFKFAAKKSYIFDSLKEMKSCNETLYALKKFRESSMAQLIDGEDDLDRAESPSLEQNRIKKRKPKSPSRMANRDHLVSQEKERPSDNTPMLYNIQRRMDTAVTPNIPDNPFDYNNYCPKKEIKSIRKSPKIDVDPLDNAWGDDS